MRFADKKNKCVGCAMTINNNKYLYNKEQLTIVRFLQILLKFVNIRILAKKIKIKRNLIINSVVTDLDELI